MKKNKQIIVTVGVPASGKTTWAKNFVKENPSYVKIERDDFRYGMKDISIGDKKFENFITELQYKTIHTALNNKYNVIVSDTNCNLKYLKVLLEEFKYKADVTLKFFNTPVGTCYDRDANRERSVGHEIIDKMVKGYQDVLNEYIKEWFSQDLLNNYIKDNFSQEVFLSRQEFIYKSTMNYDENILEYCIIVDLDGTLAHTNGKRGYYDWKKVGEDYEDDNILDLILNYHKYKIIFLTGRSKECENETRDWLRKKCNLFVEDYILLMREPKDFRPSTVVKKELYENFVKDKYNVIFAIDDKEDICNMWRSLGIKALQCMTDK